jgi:hypothetical protein
MDSIRSAEQVFLDHLRLAESGDIEADVRQNYSPDVVLLTGIGILRGHDGVRKSRELLARDAPRASVSYVTRLVEGEFAFLEWQAEAEAVQVNDGADAFLIRDGLIQCQAIHYTVTHRPGFHRRIDFHPASGRPN